VNDWEDRYRLTEKQYWFRAVVGVFSVVIALVGAAMVVAVRMHGVVAVATCVGALLFAGIIASGIGDAFDRWRGAR
jgi:hypothetical protein